MFERHKCTNFHIEDIRHLRKYFTTGDILTSAMCAARNDTTKRCPNVGTTNLIVNLPQPDFDELGVRECEITIGLGLLEFEFRDEVGALQFELPA